MRRALLTGFLLAVLASAPARAAGCGGVPVLVPGAERQQSACLGDLTTAGTVATGHTDPTDWAGLHAAGTRNPSGVPGLQIDGYFPDSSHTNPEHGWNHDAQFVLRLPDAWNGKLVVTGAPGVRRQYSADFVIGDWALARGYAYAATDKGNTGTAFYTDGTQPADAIAEWHERVTQLAVAAKAAVRARYGSAPRRTYMTGISNGGYLTRWQLEHHPELFDGGVDWEGTLFRAEGPNLLTYLPVALRNFPRYQATGDRAAHDAMIAAGFAPGSEFLWPDHYAEYWDLTQRTYREELDPGWDGPLQAGVPFCASGTPACDADYDYASRPPAVKQAVARISLTGAIKRPLLTLHGTLDALLPIATDSDVYARMVDAAGAGARHRYYVIEHGNHVDGRYDAFPDRLRPILPCYRAAFIALERWVEARATPPHSQFVPDRRGGDVVNSCSLAGAAAVPRRAPRGLTLRLRRRGGRLLASGRLLMPAGVTRARGCAAGTVAVRARRRHHTIAFRRARLRAGCGYRVTLRVRRHAARRVRSATVLARFSGNAVLAPRAARPRRARLP